MENGLKSGGALQPRFLTLITLPLPGLGLVLISPGDPGATLSEKTRSITVFISFSSSG